MGSKAPVFQKYFGVSTHYEAKQFRIPERGALPGPLATFTKLTLPYEAPDNPGLPSLQEIDEAMKTGMLSSRHSFRDVWKVGNVVVKADWTQHLVQEAEDMLWLHEHTDVRAPKLYAIFGRDFLCRDDDIFLCRDDVVRTKYYMIMEFLEGETLASMQWSDLNDEQRENINESMAEQLRVLRSVPAEGYYGRVNEQAYWPQTALTQTNEWTSHGPFKTYEDLISAMRDAAEVSALWRAEFGGPNCPSPDLYTEAQIAHLKVFKDMFRAFGEHEPKLTHLDPSLMNILVRSLDGATIQDAKQFEVTFIDWSFLGWYPAWAQASIFASHYDWTTKAPNPSKPYDEKVEERKRCLGQIMRGMCDEDPELKKFLLLLIDDLPYSII